MKWILLMIIFISACQTTEKKGKDELIGKPPISVSPPPQLSLSWESGHPERAEWSRALLEIVEKDLSAYLGAKDLGLPCPKFFSLDKQKQIRAIAELWIAVIYYESGFDPKSQSVDVGQKDKRSTWSIGLCQISEIDQAWLTLDKRFSYEELLTPNPNMIVANAIMKLQISKRGKFFLDNSDKIRYFAVALHNNKYSQINNIVSRVKKHAEFCQ